jgi:photosystem II stability/assembly factor-like uncharacterized protein
MELRCFLSGIVAALVLSSTAAAQVPAPSPETLKSVKALRAYIKNAKKQWTKMALRQGKSKAEARAFGEKKTDYWEAIQEYLKERAYPYDSIDTLAYQRGIRQRERLATTVLRGPLGPARPGRRTDFGFDAPPLLSGGAMTWEYVGPKKLPVPYTTYFGPSGSSLGGRIGGLAFHPTDVNTAFAAMPAGGVWKTTDNGLNWSHISASFPVPYCSSVAVSPADPQLVLVGMGDYDGGIDQGLGQGIMRSTDGGANWTLVGTTMAGLDIGAIVFDPDTPNIVLASSTGGIYRSTDSGATWTRVRTGNTFTISVGAADTSGNRYYYAGLNGSGGVLRSADRGQTWTAVGLSSTTSSQRHCLSASATDPDTFYLMRTSQQTIERGVRNPATDTYTWTDISAGFPNGNASLGTTYNWSQSSYDSYLNVVPQSVGGVVRDVVYVGLITVAAWDGTSWTDYGTTYTSTAKTHNDQHCMAFFPADPNRMLIGNDGGIYGVTYTSGAATPWAISATLNDTIYATMFYQADFHPFDPARMVGGTQDNASPLAQGNLAAWLNSGGGDGCESAINPINPNTVYVTSQRNYVYGVASQPTMSGENVPFVSRLGLDPRWPNPLYLGTNYLHRYNPITSSWTLRVGGYQFSTGSALRTVHVAPSDSRTIYVGLSNGPVFVSTDYGANWRQIVNLNRAVTDINISPTDSKDILVTVSGTGTGHLWRCADTSVATPVFTDLSGAGGSGLPNVAANSVTRDWRFPASDFFVGTDIGVFSTQNGGATWTNMTLPMGLPNCQVNTVSAVKGTGYLMAATFGRGIWRLKLDEPAPPAPVLISTTVTLSRTATAINATVTVRNDGPGTANNVLLTASRLTATTSEATTTALPVSCGTLAPRASVSRVLAFPLTVGAAGVRGNITISGAHDTSTFGSALRVTLP